MLEHKNIGQGGNINHSPLFRIEQHLTAVGSVSLTTSSPEIKTSLFFDFVSFACPRLLVSWFSLLLLLAFLCSLCCLAVSVFSSRFVMWFCLCFVCFAQDVWSRWTVLLVLFSFSVCLVSPRLSALIELLAL